MTEAAARQTPEREGSLRVVLIALAGNLGIAVVKCGAFFLTHSTAMLTEAIHSLVDTIDQLLLLVAERRSEKPGDPAHPFGYGMETYFWSFIVALMIFLAGAIAAIWQGVEKLLHPAPIESPWISLLVLAASALFEGMSFRSAYREYRAVVRGRRVRLWAFIKLSKDPSLFSTLLEDGAALIGLSIVAIGTLLSWLAGVAWADGVASILIGALLAAIAAVLTNETRSLIAGEAAAPPIADAARAAAEADPDGVKILEFDTLHLGPKAILVTLDVRFADNLDIEGQAKASEELSRRIMATDPRICGVYRRVGSRAS